MNTITIKVAQARSWSTPISWRAVAFINGVQTTCVCGHSHSSEALALKCAEGNFALEMEPFANAEIVALENGAHEARWTEADGTEMTERFRFAK